MSALAVQKLMHYPVSIQICMMTVWYCIVSVLLLCVIVVY